MSVLTFTAGLSCVLVVNVRCGADRLAVGYLRTADICLYLKFTKQTVNDNLKVQLTHTGNNGLAGLVIRIGTEGRVFLCQLGKGNAHLLLSGFGLRLDCDADNRFREFHRFQNDRRLFVTKSITGCGVLQADCGCNITGIYRFDIFTVVCVHLQNTSDSLLIILDGIVNVRTAV